ncbi:SDR family NAD(P)-dependent oxidoreductase [Kineosporia succinea]|uniref:NAD(P)-dependent dehydrogenase (Short-subunit alcohol dehydrogenase family) n=1 Tax=Kineosporia succinea TaxID=84632 RepID=A0ABT9P3S9_9ACTN|nr:SDR family oxidoreductase [Kineosporia succinea]MDP9826860.1 NAD(P)-dependent dehydrogenase (short-subunit alcohol dehydrogenase family) [Kineosporia succinea]
MPVALVTGASSGLGRALAAALADAGWDVVVDARGASRLTKALAPYPNVHRHPGDVTDSRHRRELIAACTELGGLDLLVNNAGGLGPSPLPALGEFPLSSLEDLFTVNVVAPLGLIQLALPILAERDGTIVNITSDAASAVYPGWGGYGATKAALEQIGAVLGAECTGSVRVYSFDPGDLRTPMHQAAFPDEDISDRPLPESVVPAFVKLLEERPSNGRYSADDLKTTEVSA